MRRLLLLRHAEAQAAKPGLGDFDRRLTSRGQAQARQAAQRLAAGGLRPDLLLTSPAARTLETAEIVAAGLGYAGRIGQQPELYLASAQALLSSLQGCHAGAQALLLVGHNPGLCALARELTGVAALELGHCALCCLALELSSWAELGPQAVQAVSMP